MDKALSQSLEDYLEAIYIIGLDNKVVRVKEVAGFLDVRPPSVVDAVGKLTENGLVNHEKYGYLDLTDEGNKLARKIHLKHEKLQHNLQLTLYHNLHPCINSMLK